MPKNKIVVLDVARNVPHNLWFPAGGGVYLVNYSNIYTYNPIDGVTPVDQDFQLDKIGLDTAEPIISFEVDRELYRKVDNKEDCYGLEIEKVWYNDPVQRYLYVRFENTNHPYVYPEERVEIGFAEGYMKSSSDWSGIIPNRQQYREKLVESALFEETKDDPFTSIQKITDSSAVLSNSDYELSPFTVGAGVKNRCGNYARTRIFEGTDEELANIQDEDFQLVAQSIINDVEEGVEISLDLLDLRTSLDVKSPTRELDNNLYSDLSDSDDTNIIPEAWGKVFSVNPLCLNEQVNEDDGSTPNGSTAYKFLLCDAQKPRVSSLRELGTNSIKAVYLEGKKIPLTGITLSQENDLHVMTIPASVFYTRDDGSISFSYRGMSDITVDFEGYLDEGDVLIENSMVILENIIYDNYGWDKSDIYYDIDTWNFYRDQAYKCGYYFDKPVTVREKSEKIAADNWGTFIWDENLKFSWDSDEFLGTYDFTMTEEDFHPEDYIPAIARKPENTLAQFRIGYLNKHSIGTSEDNKEIKYSWVLDDTNKDNAFLNFRTDRSKDFATNLTDAADIPDLQGKIHQVADIADDRIAVSVPWRYLSANKVGDWGLVRVNLPQRNFVGWTRCKILRKSPNMASWRTDLTLRIFEYFHGIEYNNTEVEYDFQDLIYVE